VRSWIARGLPASPLMSGVHVTYYFDDYAQNHPISANDRIFIVESKDPTILHGWGTVKEVNRNESRIIGDDEEANTPPYSMYDAIIVNVNCEETFLLPLSLSAYLSHEDFDAYEDEYGNRYGGVLSAVPETLSDKLNQAIDARRKTGAPLFLSYAHEDFQVALRLSHRLADEGFHVWFDKESLFPGQNWKAEITRAIRGSKAFIALLSSNSVGKRGYVQKELRLALDVLEEMPPCQVYLIPARLEDCRPAYAALDEIQWLDLFPDFEKGFRRLVTAVRRIDNQGQTG